MGEREISQEPDRLWQATLDTIPELVAIQDEEGRILRCNAAFAEYVSLPHGEILGKMCCSVLHRSDDPIEGCMREACLKTGELARFELSDPRTGKVFEASIRPWSAPDGTTRGTIHLLRDITDASRFRAGFAARFDPLQSVFDAVPHPIFFKGVDGRYVGCNEAFAATVAGLTKEAIFGRRREEVLQPDPEHATLRDDPDILRSGVPSFEEVPMRFADGKRHQVSLSRDVLRDPKGAVIGLVGVITDLTREKGLYDELRAKNETLEAANRDLGTAYTRAVDLAERADEASRAKNNFLAMMSHEIRTPLNGIIGMTDLLVDGELNETKRSYVDILRLSADALLSIIEDILDFSKIEAGKMTIDERGFDLESVIEGCLDMLVAKGAKKGLDLCASIEPSVPISLTGDPLRLQQVLLNILGNAIKFTDSGSVRLRVALLSRNADAASLRFSVKDTGIGIPADKVSSLFQQFNQVDGSSVRRYGGTGLGLALSKKLVELMGGTIGVESVQGAGSDFWFKMPFGCAPEDERARRKPESAQALRRVLALGMPEASAEALAEMLAGEGIAVDRADSLPAGYPAASDGTLYAAVIFGEGAGTIGTLTAAAGSPPAFAYAASTSVRDEAENAEPGLAGTIHAPLKRRQVLALLAPRISPKAERKTAADTARGSRDQWRHRALVVEDNPINTIIIRKILAKEGVASEAAANGLEAVKMLSKHRFDCVFLDLYMPIMDGFEALKIIRDPGSSVLDHDVPVAALSASSLSEDRQKCEAAGIDEFITKPVRMQTIRDSLDRLLPGRLGSDAEAFAEVLDSLNGDAELFAELIDKFAADTDQRMEALRDIVERGDPAGSAQLRQLTHAISGSALSMGAAALAEAARALSGAAGKPGAWMELFTTMAEKRAEADRKLRFASESAKRGTKT